MTNFSHLDSTGKARMVDVGDKKDQKRYARAAGHIAISQETLALVKEHALKKGDVLTVAEIAGVQAAKQTAHLIPLCHTLLLEKVRVNTIIQEKGIWVECEVQCTGKTGVEMEALTGASVALLTIYDMCKAVDKAMVIGEIKLIEKTKTDIHE
jgi:cyclic pyranopterin phosphate synthase